MHNYTETLTVTTVAGLPQAADLHAPGFTLGFDLADAITSYALALLPPSGDERIQEFTAGHPERSIGWLRHDVEGTTFLGGVTNGSAADLVRLAAVAVEAIETGGVIRDGIVYNVWAPATKP